MPTYNNGSNSNLDSDGKCAVVLMRVEAMEAQRALNRTPRAAHPAKTKSRKLPRGNIRRSYVRLGFQNLSQTDRSSFGFSSFRFRGFTDTEILFHAFNDEIQSGE